MVRVVLLQWEQKSVSVLKRFIREIFQTKCQAARIQFKVQKNILFDSPYFRYERKKKTSRSDQSRQCEPSLSILESCDANCCHWRRRCRCCCCCWWSACCWTSARQQRIILQQVPIIWSQKVASFIWQPWMFGLLHSMPRVIILFALTKVVLYQCLSVIKFCILIYWPTGHTTKCCICT